MSIFAKAGSILSGGLVESAGKIIDDLHTSDEERGAIDIEKLRLELLPVLREADERVAQAKHPSLFVAGARPAMMWIAGGGVGFNVIGVALLNWVGAMWGGDVYIPLERLDWTELTVLVGLAGGTGWMRHMDKVKGVARINMSSPS